MVATIKVIPSPLMPTLYEVGGVEKTLSGWAQHSGIAKTTPWSRLEA